MHNQLFKNLDDDMNHACSKKKEHFHSKLVDADLVRLDVDTRI
jgi:hypothetical protein